MCHDILAYYKYLPLYVLIKAMDNTCIHKYKKLFLGQNSIPNFTNKIKYSTLWNNKQIHNDVHYEFKKNYEFWFI